MTFVSFGLLRKNLGNLRDFWANGSPPPGKKLPVRLCLYDETSFAIDNKESTVGFLLICLRPLIL